MNCIIFKRVGNSLVHNSLFADSEAHFQRANCQYKYGTMIHLYLCVVVNSNMDKKLYVARSFVKATRNMNLDPFSMQVYMWRGFRCVY